jgi:hypothetical protein
MIVKNKQTAEDRAFWAHCEAVAAEVKSWPKWMGGDREDVIGFVPFVISCPGCGNAHQTPREMASCLVSVDKS